MKPSIVQGFCLEKQHDLYYKLNRFSVSNPLVGRLGALPVALLDVALDTVSSIGSVIESKVLFIANIVFAAFSNRYGLKDALACAEFTVMFIGLASIKFTLFPVKTAYQTIAILIDPVRVNSIDYYRPTFS